MTSTVLTRDNLTATFEVVGQFVEITEQTRQKIGVRVEEVTNAWHGLSRPTGKIATQIINGHRWTSVPTAKARRIWAQMVSQGWQRL
jgi:phage gp16-like protein